MDSFLLSTATSTAAVAIAEIGDKTQLFALILACRYGRPWPVAFGILIATIANHLLAGAVGALVANRIPYDYLQWGVGLSFIVIAAWTLIPDKVDEDDDKPRRFGPFLASLIGFFLLEMGDKTQIITVMLAADHKPFVAVMIGSIAGMMLVNLPIVFAGKAMSARIPLSVTRKVAAALFVILGVLALPIWR